MGKHASNKTEIPGRPAERPEPSGSRWVQRYGDKHRLRRITDFPAGIMPPKRVRVYARGSHYIVQWWDKAAKKTLSDRVDGDLVNAIVRAREIEERIRHFGSSAKKHGRVPHRELVEQFVTNLNRRADAGQIDPKTVVRYRSALTHYLNFAEQTSVEAKYASAANVNRQFALELAAFLGNLKIAPNGHPHSQKRRMTSTRYVENVVRSMFHWAADPQRGGLMPDGFFNPFAGRSRKSHDVAPDPFGEPDVTLQMAAEFILACDRFQLPLFALIAFYGLRPSELCFLFHENLVDSWLNVACIPALGYVTKGRRDKRLPLIGELSALLHPAAPNYAQGLLFVKRRVAEQRESPPLLSASQDALRQIFSERCSRQHDLTAVDRIRIRDQVLKQSGGLNYDHVEHEFRCVARQLNWPASATIKDFRHLFSTLLQNAGMPEFYRRYLMGHSLGTAAIVTYSHLNELRQRYEEAVERAFQPLVDAVARRSRELGFPDCDHRPMTTENH